LGGGRPVGGGDGWRTIRDPTAVEATGLGQSRGAPRGKGERKPLPPGKKAAVQIA
jgi:hypothetical protein